MSSLHEDTLDAINEILPEIQAKLKEDILEEEQARMKQELEDILLQLQSKAQQQYHQALLQLERESQYLKEEQTIALQRQIEKTQIQIQEKERKHQTELQEKFISDNFQHKVLSHERILALEDVLMEEICLQYEEKFEQTKSRKTKEILVKLEQKQQKDRKEKDKQIKNKVYASMGLQQLKKDIQILRVGVASMKSQYNVKLKKIDTEIKETKLKNKELERSSENVIQLRIKLQELKEQKQNKSIVNSKNISYMHSFSLERDHEYLQPDEDIVMESQEQSQLQYQSQEQSQIHHPPRYEPQLFQEEKIDIKNPILGFDIGALLREQWEIDPLQKYVSNSTKENDSRMGNKSSFQEQYHEKLKKMNGRKKLSENSKNQIIKNLTKRKY